MPTGSYNVSRLLAELGLKNVAEMPVLPSIQPTIPLGSMAGQVPVHVGSVALGGGVAAAVVGERSTFQLQVLDPGGAVLSWIQELSGSWSNVIVGDTPAAWVTGPTACSVYQFNNGIPSPSLVNMGTVVGGPLLTEPELAGDMPIMPVSNFAPLYIPRGQYFQLVNTALNQEFRATLCWCGITATEGGD